MINRDHFNYTNKNQPLVSAIVSTYNSEKFIRGKIEDLLEQTIADKLEIIIINSGSQQNEDAIIKEYLANYSNIKYIKTEERETIYKAWNRGIKISSGKYITNANTDDRLRNDAFEVLANELDNNPDVALVYADQYITFTPNEKFNIQNAVKVIKMPEFNPMVQLERCIVLSQPMWRRTLHFEDNIWFDEKIEICGDHEFELHVSSIYKMKHVPIVLGSFYKSNSNLNKSFNNIKLVKYERKTITYNYMRSYICNMSEQELKVLWKKFRIYIYMPILLGRIIIRIKSLIRKNKHVYSQEFIFLFMSFAKEKLNKINDAIFICNKYLSRRSSWTIEKQLKNLKNRGN